MTLRTNTLSSMNRILTLVCYPLFKINRRAFDECQGQRERAETASWEGPKGATDNDDIPVL